MCTGWPPSCEGGSTHTAERGARSLAQERGETSGVNERKQGNRQDRMPQFGGGGANAKKKFRNGTPAASGQKKRKGTTGRTRGLGNVHGNVTSKGPCNGVVTDEPKRDQSTRS